MAGSALEQSFSWDCYPLFRLECPPDDALFLNFFTDLDLVQRTNGREVNHRLRESDQFLQFFAGSVESSLTRRLDRKMSLSARNQGSVMHILEALETTHSDGTAFASERWDVSLRPAAAAAFSLVGSRFSRLAACSAAGLILILALTGCSRHSEPTDRPLEPTRLGASAAPAAEPSADESDSIVATTPSPEQPASDVISVSEAPGVVDSDLMSLDPREDGWLTEHFNNVAGGRLKELGHLIEDRTTLDVAHAGVLVEPDLAVGALTPATTVAREDETFHVARVADPPSIPQAVRAADRYHGVDGLVAALTDLTSHYRADAKLRTKFKIIRVELSAGAARTVQYVQVTGETETGRSEQNTTWVTDWRWDNSEAVPTVKKLASTDYERADVAGPPLFSDCTLSAFAGAEDLFHRQFNIGIGSWIRRLEAHFGTLQTGMSGIAVGDVNGDHLEDVYVCQTGGLPNRLLIHQPDGTVRDIAASAGVDVLDHTHAALLIDVDNDGDEDLVLAATEELLLFANDGTGGFRLVGGVGNLFHPHSLAAADYDRDGDLDVYACVYYPHGSVADELPVPAPIYDARNGGRNALFRNDGNMRFVDVTAEVGLDEDNSRFSYAAVWEDYDQDGDDDLYVVNDFGDNNLYRNDDGTFVEVTEEAGLHDGTFGMSASAADYNRDGWVDFYKANMFSSAGNRITTQQHFMENLPESHRSRMFHLARGNTLFRNINGRFEDVSVHSGTKMGRWSWGSLFTDIDNDGWEDLFVGNGFITGEQLDDL